MNKIFFNLFCKYYSLVNSSSKSKSFLLAHRGLTSRHLENTLPAFLEAMNLGADGVELDVQITLDNELVVFHDDDLYRLANDKRFIKQIKFKELENIKLKHISYNCEYTIPSLELVLSKMPKDAIINIELKTSFINANQIAYKSLIDLLCKYSEKLNLIISSFNIETLTPLLKSKNNFKLAFLVDKKISYKELIKSFKIIKKLNFINPHIDLIGNNLLKNIETYNINLITWGHKIISNKTDIIRKKNISIISDICEQFFIKN